MKPSAYKASEIKVVDKPVDIPSLLETLRRHPALWLGEESLIAFRAYIDGFRDAERLYDLPDDQRFSGFDWECFEHWVMARYNPHMLSVRSFGLAQEMTDSDSAAFWKWFEIYDVYCAELKSASPERAGS